MNPEQTSHPLEQVATGEPLDVRSILASVRLPRLSGGGTPAAALSPQESPQNRLIVALKSANKTHQQIAEEVGVSMDMVATVLRQPWAQKMLIAKLKESGQDSYQAILDTTAVDCLFVLIELRDTKTNSASIRLAAAKELLDRAKGKPKIVGSILHERALPQSLSDLDRELEAERAQQRDLTGRTRVREVAAVQVETISR